MDSEGADWLRKRPPAVGVRAPRHQAGAYPGATEGLKGGRLPTPGRNKLRGIVVSFLLSYALYAGIKPLPSVVDRRVAVCQCVAAVRSCQPAGGVSRRCGRGGLLPDLLRRAAELPVPWLCPRLAGPLRPAGEPALHLCGAARAAPVP